MAGERATQQQFSFVPAVRLPAHVGCTACPHNLGRHRYMHTVATPKGPRDMYRCRACDCGKNLEIRAIAIGENATELDVRRAMRALDAGAGTVIDGRTIS